MDVAAKQQVAERLKQAQNILVTVSTNPSVDQLAACIGLTLLLNKTGKHTTAVFSGKVPSTIEFLQPEKTIEQNTDSLRDFIISLDKNKADKLRYKVEDDVVKIFITPYRTSLSDKDLIFSQGDFNVEAVIALGVKDKTQLDAAITAHGRILHDATVISVNSGNVKVAGVGQINWADPAASSLSEMIVSISEALGSNLIDNQMATAFLTGIVAETQRFSNPKTSPKVMTMSAQLMAAGANQQLIVSKLETVIEPKPAPKPVAPAPKPVAPLPPPVVDGTLNVQHENSPKAPEAKLVENKPEPTVQVNEGEINIDNEGNILLSGDEPSKEASPQVEQPKVETPKPEAPQPEPAPPVQPVETAPQNPASDTPTPGSHELLTSQSGGPVLVSPFTATTEPGWGTSSQEGATDPMNQSLPNSGILNHAPVVKPREEPTTYIDANQLQAPGNTFGAPHIEQARNAVESAFAAAPFDPALSPVAALNAVPMEPAPVTQVQPQQVQAAAEPVQEQKDEAPAPPAPPPVPPPLMPSPGVVIPSQPISNNNIDANTL